MSVENARATSAEKLMCEGDNRSRKWGKSLLFLSLFHQIDWMVIRRFGLKQLKTSACNQRLTTKRGASCVGVLKVFFFCKTKIQIFIKLLLYVFFLEIYSFRIFLLIEWRNGKLHRNSSFFK